MMGNYSNMHVLVAMQKIVVKVFVLTKKERPGVLILGSGGRNWMISWSIQTKLD